MVVGTLPVHHKGLVVELIGPAGAGKSTLFHALQKSAPGICCEYLPPVWSPAYVPFFLKNILALPPALIHLPGKADRFITRRELAWMAILNGWPKMLAKKNGAGGNVILLDQGPIFLIAVLSIFGPRYLLQIRMQDWWEKIYSRWAQTIGMVVWLDTSDAVLTDRVRERESPHPIQSMPDPEAHDFLARYRSVYEDVVSHMRVYYPGIRVVRVDTGQFGVDEMVKKVEAAFDQVKGL